MIGNHTYHVRKITNNKDDTIEFKYDKIFMRFPPRDK